MVRRLSGTEVRTLLGEAYHMKGDMEVADLCDLLPWPVDGQDILHILWSPNVHWSVHKDQTLDLILS
jgi:hypothetical protein